ncbi:MULTISPECIES: GNAT family N-acetyltransferase [unclassified Mesorhizobium]|uniref:GNAT family N-acetyltransferase n=1 Tax=unclassified Mesorhizobium TaxID=325217 RepID=UPI003014FF96
MNDFTIRPAEERDRAGIHEVEERAFGQAGEAMLVDRLVADGDVVLELVAEKEGRIVGHVFFSRLMVEENGKDFAAVALAPLAVDPDLHGQGIGGALVREAHERLKLAGEKLSIVLGDPDYYGRFGYHRSNAEKFESDYQCYALQSLAWSEAPSTGRLVYAPAFRAL